MMTTFCIEILATFRLADSLNWHCLRQKVYVNGDGPGSTGEWSRLWLSRSVGLTGMLGFGAKDKRGTNTASRLLISPLNSREQRTWRIWGTKLIEGLVTGRPATTSSTSPHGAQYEYRGASQSPPSSLVNRFPGRVRGNISGHHQGGGSAGEAILHRNFLCVFSHVEVSFI